MSCFGDRRTAVMSGAALVALALVTGSARANGRFPAAAQLVVDPTDGARIVVRTTFGLLQSTDSGKTWRWICEQQVGFAGTFDPAIVLHGGVLLAGLPDSISRTVDRGCTWSRAGAPVRNEYWIDLAATDRLIAVSSPIDPALGFRALVVESRDLGATWTLTASPLPEDLAPATIDVAPSRPSRIYVSGVGPFKRFATVARSDDFGATFTESTFDMGAARAPYIAAVDPANADRVWLRLDGEEGDRLLLSTDGGVRFEEVHAGTELLGFALSPDGSRVAVGGPTDGLWIARTSDLAFARVSATRVKCLTWTAAGLWACGDESADGFSVGLSRDDGKTFEPRLRFVDLEPLACVKTACDSAWREVSNLIGAGRTDAGVDAPVVVPDSSTDLPAIEPGGGGCSCTTRPTRSRPLAFPGWMAALYFVAVRARRAPAPALR